MIPLLVTVLIVFGIIGFVNLGAYVKLAIYRWQGKRGR